MRVKLINTVGKQYLLPETLSVQGWPEETELPGIEIQGRPGEIIDGPLIRMNSRDIVVSGTLEADDKDHADEIREEIAAFCSRANPLRLFRHENADRYMLVYKRGINHGYVTGRYGGRVFTLSLEFRAADPLFYAATIQNKLHSVSVSSKKLEINNPGTVDQQPVIFIKARSGNLVDPALANGSAQMEYDGIITEGKALVINCERRIALLTDGNLNYYLDKWGVFTEEDITSPTSETNEINKISGDWLVYGFPLLPEENEITYSDDATSSHNADVSIAWRPKYY